MARERANKDRRAHFTMILTCPRCTARYAVERDQIPPAGRTVRCVSCRHKWTAMQEDGEAEPREASRPEPPRKPRAPSPPPPPPEPIVPDPPPPPVEAVDAAFPDVDPVIPSLRASRPPPRRIGPPAPLVWAGLAALLAILALMLALFRNEVVRVWPKTAALYAAAGMSVNGVGLVIEDVRLTPAVQNGQAVLGVSGKIRNERDHPAPAAALQVTLYNAAGGELARLVARPVDILPPLQTRYFSVLIRNPPPGVASAALAFVSQAPKAGKAPVAVEGAHPPEPVPAKELHADPAPSAAPAHAPAHAVAGHEAGAHPPAPSADGHD